MENKRSWTIQTRSTRNVGVRLSNQMYRDLAQYAALHGKTLTDVIKYALAQYLKSKGYKY